MSLSPEREQQIRAFEAAATPGPWHRHDDPDDLKRWVVAESNLLHIDFGYRGNSTQRDAEFVADARTAVPELLAELDRLRAKVAAVTALLPDEPTEDINASWIPPRRVRMALNAAAVVPAAGEANQ